LDVGLIRTTTGNRVFGCLKGACDGGLHVPHSTKRFPGFSSEGGKETYNAKAHRERIFGGHVEKYMKALEGDKEAYKRQFSKWAENLKKSGVKNLEALYTKVHEEIRKNPAAPKKAEKKKVEVQYADKKKTIIKTAGGKQYKIDRRLTHEERQKRVAQKIAKAQKAAQ